MAGDGFTYERKAINQWFGTGRHTSPMSNAVLKSAEVTPNYVIRSAIHEWRSKCNGSIYGANYLGAASGGETMYPYYVAPMPSAPSPPYDQ